MPFTPFHLGPAIGFGLPLRRYLHVPTFILANVIVDVEPLLVLLFGLRYPLHGYLHTFFFAFLLGLALSYVMFLLERYLKTLYATFLLEPAHVDRMNIKPFVVAGILGTMIHVLLDSPLYGDIRPFYPLDVNPLYSPSLSPSIYGLCVWMAVLGIASYVALVASLVYKKLHQKDRE